MRRQRCLTNAECASTSLPTHTDRTHQRYRGSFPGHAFFLDAVCRALYTTACSHALPRGPRASHSLFINLPGGADTDRAHRGLHDSGARAALCGVDNTGREKSAEVAWGLPVCLAQSRLWSSCGLSLVRAERKRGHPVFWTSEPLGSYRRVYQGALCLCMLVFLAACSGQHRPVVPPSARASELEGLASYYAEPYHGRRTASGEVFDTYKAMTAAHRTLPFNTVVRVQNMANGKAVQVRINDRGPFITGRIIDLSVRAARAIDMLRSGVVLVTLQIRSPGTEPRRTALDTPRDAVPDGALETLRAEDGLVVSLDRGDESATQ